MRLPGSILWRAFAVIMAALVLSTLCAIWLIDRYYGEPNADRRVALSVGHLQTISAALEMMSDDIEEQFISRLAVTEGVRVIHGRFGVRPASLVRAPDRGSLVSFRERFQQTFGPETEIYIRPGDETAPLSLLWVELSVPPGDRYWVGIPRRYIEPFAPEAIVIWSLTGLAIAILASFAILWHVTRPLAALAKATDAIGDVVDARRLPESGADEVRAVASAFNRTLDRLRHVERERSTFLAGVSHDLRTPLSHVRLEISMLAGPLEAETRREILQDLDDINAILDSFIDFARGEAAEACSPVNLAELVHECGDRYDAAIRYDFEPVPLAEVRPLAVQRLVRNLLSNAVRHGGGEVLARVRTEGANLILAVLDRGPGIAPGTEEQMKQPFTRKDDARGGASGAGLGLAIAERIARLHGGRLDLLARDGGGLEARVSLPLPARALEHPEPAAPVAVPEGQPRPASAV